MIKAIVGKKGSGKTKRLMEIVNRYSRESLGSIVCIEKGDVSTFRVGHDVRLVNTNDYNIDSSEKLYGLIAGLLAGNYDTETVYLDSTFRIIGREQGVLCDFLKRLKFLSETHHVDFVLTLSCDKSELPEDAVSYMSII